MSETLIGKYRLLAELGRGGMSDVYLAASTGLGGFQKLVVIKVSRVSDDPAFAQMFLDEARLSARLSHSNIVQTYEVGEENGRQFIVMEYLDGPSLHALNRLAAPRGGVPIRMVVQVLSEVLTGLHYAHTLSDFDGTRLNVVHRDVSPQNIMVTSHGESKLLDFGIAKTSESRTMTHAGFYRGKLNYMSPEQAVGKPVDARADVFSVGVLLAEAITRKPFWGEATTAVISARLVRGDIPDIEQANIEPLLEEICQRALLPEREQRMSSAREFKEALDLYLGTVGGPVAPEELAAFVEPLVSAERKRFHALIDQQLNQSAPPIQISVPFASSPSRAPMSSYASLTGAAAAAAGGVPAAYQSRGSGFTPISSVFSSLPSQAGSAGAPRTAPGSANTAPHVLPPPIGLSEEPPSEPILGEALSPIPFLPVAGSRSSQSVRNAARKPQGVSEMNLRFIIGLVGAGFAVLIGLVVWLATRSPAPASQSGPIEAVRPDPAVPGSGPAPVAEKTPTRAAAHVEIAATPASAIVEIDGVSVGNPYSSRQLDGKSHHLNVRADGFEAISREVTFDHELTMNLSLSRISAPARVPPPQVVYRSVPPSRPAAKPAAPSSDNSVIQELTPKQKTSPGKRSLDTEIFDEKKPEIDRSAPWEN